MNKKSILTESQREFLEQTNISLVMLLEAEAIHSDDDPDLSKDEEREEQPQEGSEGEEGEGEEGEGEEQEPTLEDIVNFEITGTEDKFTQFTLYDNLLDMSDKIQLLIDNIKNDELDKKLNILPKLEHYLQYLNVLNELIFSINTASTYKILGQIKLEVIELLVQYNEALKEEDSKKSKENKRKFR